MPDKAQDPNDHLFSLNGAREALGDPPTDYEKYHRTFTYDKKTVAIRGGMVYADCLVSHVYRLMNIMPEGFVIEVITSARDGNFLPAGQIRTDAIKNGLCMESGRLYEYVEHVAKAAAKGCRGTLRVVDPKMTPGITVPRKIVVPRRMTP